MTTSAHLGDRNFIGLSDAQSCRRQAGFQQDHPRRAQASPQLLAALARAPLRPITPEAANLIKDCVADTFVQSARPSAAHPQPDESTRTQRPKESSGAQAPKVKSGARHNSIFYQRATFEWRILDRNSRAKLWVIAQSMERITKKKGCRNGCLGATGLLVLNCLLFRFLNANSGRCDPSYDALQKMTGLCRQSIATALDRLEAAGLITVVRRMMHFIGEHGVRVVRQISNAYLITRPAELKVPAGASDADPHPRLRCFPPRRKHSGLGGALAALFNTIAGRNGRPSLSDRGKPKTHPLSPRFSVQPV